MAVKLMTIILKVEPPALGPVLLKLKEMPGIAEFNLEMNDSKASPDPAQEQLPKPNAEELLTALLIKGPLSIDTAHAALARAGWNGKRVSVAQILYVMKRNSIVKSAEKGVYELTAKAARSIKGHEDTAIRLLPKPRSKTTLKANAAAIGYDVTNKTNGKHPPKARKSTRAGPGVAQRAVLAALADGPARRDAIRPALEKHGLSPKSVEGVIARGRVAGFVALKDGLASLTAKGKAELEKLNAEAANG